MIDILHPLDTSMSISLAICSWDKAGRMSYSFYLDLFASELLYNFVLTIFISLVILLLGLLYLLIL